MKTISSKTAALLLALLSHLPDAAKGAPTSLSAVNDVTSISARSPIYIPKPKDPVVDGTPGGGAGSTVNDAPDNVGAALADSGTSDVSAANGTPDNVGAALADSGTSDGSAARSGDESKTGGVNSGARPDQPAEPASDPLCKRGGDCKFDAKGYPLPGPFSKDDESTLKARTKKATPANKNSKEAYTDRYKRAQTEFAKYRADKGQEVKDEAAIKQKFKDNYVMVPDQGKTLEPREIKDMTDLGIKDPGKLKRWAIHSKTNGMKDPQKMVDILVSDDGTTIVAAWTFAKHDGNLNKLDSKGNPTEIQSPQYRDVHRLSNSDINWSFIDEITKGDKAKAQKVEYWMRQHVINDGTVAQIFRSHQAMGWPGEGTRGKFTYNKQSGKDQEIVEYKALMGTENLSPVGYMYADHVQYFDGRYPLEIYTLPTESDTDIWTKIGRVPTGKGQQGLPS